MRTIQSVLYQRNKKDKAGIIKIRITEDRKHSYVSTEEKLPARLWNSRTGKVKESSEVDYERINQLIEDKLKEVRATFNEVLQAGKTTSFLDFFRKVIERKQMRALK